MDYWELHDVLAGAERTLPSLDWVRLIGPRRLYEVPEHPSDLKDRLVNLDPENIRPNEIAPWNLKAYKGFQADGYALGIHKDNFCIEARSSEAEPFAMAWAGESLRCTRLDIAIDLYFDDTTLNIAKVFHERYMAVRNGLFGEGNAPHCDYWDGEKGDTLYIGKRTSPRFFRLYDKSAEQKRDVQSDGVRIWRWELELKGRDAQFGWDMLGPKVNRELIKGGILAEYLDAHGLMAYPIVNVERVARRTMIHKPTSLDKRLAWLKKTVKPMIERGIENGDFAFYADALGISELFGG